MNFNRIHSYDFGYDQHYLPISYYAAAPDTLSIYIYFLTRRTISVLNHTEECRPDYTFNKLSKFQSNGEVV